MAAEIVHDSAREFTDILLIFVAAVAVIHVGFQLENVADQFPVNRFNAELKRGIAAEHEAHLERKIPLFAAVEQFFILREILAGGLVHVHGQIALHAAQRDRDEVVVRNLHRDGLKTGRIERLIERQFPQSLVGFYKIVTETRRFGEFPVVDITDDIEHLRQFPQRIHFPVGMFVRDADLGDSDSIHFFEFLPVYRMAAR